MAMPGVARRIPQPPSVAFPSATRGIPALHSSANAHASVAKWLVGTAGVVVLIVHVGGVTRLTRSGLSMTYWKPTQVLPPITPEEWEAEFTVYKSFPEFQQRRSMDIEEFKSIFYWEWGHRILGRISGVVFVLPAAYFAARGMIPKGYGWRVAGLLGMGAGQGAVGWWMVASGLGNDRRGDKKEIRVSPYRLAVHLSMAFATYTGLVWNGIDLLHGGGSDGGAAARRRYVVYASKLSLEARHAAKKLRGGVIVATVLTAATAASGAFVAGLDAGCAYNTWPDMEDGNFVPEDIWDPDLGMLNPFENTATVQFDHRILAYATFLSSVGAAAYGLRRGMISSGAVTPQAAAGITAMGAAATGQAALGVATLLNHVPIGMAAGHQMGSLVLLTSGLYTVQALRYGGPAALRAAAAGPMGAGRTATMARTILGRA